MILLGLTRAWLQVEDLNQQAQQQAAEQFRSKDGASAPSSCV